MDSKAFKKTGLTYKKTAKIPWKCPSVEVQEDFSYIYEMYLEKAKKWKIHLLSYDPTHPMHNSINGKMWQEKGKEWTIKIKSNTGRKRLNIMWWINLVNLKFVWILTEENCNRETTKSVLQKIRNEYSDGKEIVIILDNARYQRSYEVQELAETLNIELVFLPPYCPNLSLVERIWKFFKKTFLENHYYEKFDEFVTASSLFFSNFDNYHDDISKLIHGKLQIIKYA